MRSVRNKTFDQIGLGDTASAERRLQARDIRAWAAAFGEAGDAPGAAGIITALLTSLVETVLPGPGSNIRSSTVRVRAGLPLDVVLTTRLTVREKRADEGLVILDGVCNDPTGQPVANAVIEVIAPTSALIIDLPEHRLEGLLERCRGLEAMPTGIVHPCSVEALAGALEAEAAGLIVPVLFGPEAELRRIAAARRFSAAAAALYADALARDPTAILPARSE